MFWEDPDLSPATQQALRNALIETSLRSVEPEHALLTLLEDDQSPLVKAARFLKPAFNPKAMRDNVLITVKSSLTVPPPAAWSPQLLHRRFQEMVDSARNAPEWSDASPERRNQLMCAAVVQAIKPSAKLVLTAAGVAPAELEARLRKPVVQSSLTVFEPTGIVNLQSFDRGAQKILRLIESEGQGRGLNRIVSSLVLLGFASADGGILQTALRLQTPTVDPKKLRDNLSLHVQALGSGRFNNDLAWRKELLQPAVVTMLERSLSEAAGIEAERIGEAELLKGFLLAGDAFVESFLRGEKVDIPELSRYVNQRRTGEVTQGEPEPPKQLSIEEIEQHLRSSVIGQEQAIDIVMPMIKRLRFGYTRKGRPAGVLLFVGLSGTGKTQLAKEIARSVYGDEEQLIFLEMGQFGSEHSKTSFVGAPPGLVGYGEGILTNGLRDKPESVVLFDEVEKAHKSVFDVVLRFLDEGQISDAGGAVRDGRRCVLVLTSNLGVRELEQLIQEQTQAGQLSHDARAAIRSQVRNTLLKIDFFRPEFLNRVDEIVLFNRFTRDAFHRIMTRLLESEKKRFHDDKELTVSWDQHLLDFLVKSCEQRSDEGARVCGRLVSDFFVTPLIDFFLNPLNTKSRGAHVRWDGERIAVDAMPS
ncbi:MAG TPA: AAA family ATPase [Planctomycetaceae bacterium]|nr:AAA family ATPase [Planctomycetaceae bacterium]